MKDELSHIINDCEGIMQKLDNHALELKQLKQKLEGMRPKSEIYPNASVEGYINKDDFLKLMKISNSTFWKWRKEGKIKIITLGKGITFIHKSEIEKLLKNAA